MDTEHKGNKCENCDAKKACSKYGICPYNNNKR